MRGSEDVEYDTPVFDVAAADIFASCERTPLVGNNKPSQLSHLFASIQSINSKRFIKEFKPGFFDFIIVDEFHHAAADSYQDLLEYFKPKILLGLTATPERMDGKDL